MNNKVEIIKRAKSYYIKGCCLGMCESFNYAIELECDKDIIQLFNRDIAINLFGARNRYGFWWPIEERKIRIKYFNWLIKQYENEKENRV